MTRKQAANVALAWCLAFLALSLLVILGAVAFLGAVGLAIWQAIAGGDIVPPLLWALVAGVGTWLLTTPALDFYDRFDRARKVWERKVETGE